VSLTADGKLCSRGSPPGQSITVFDLQKMEIAWEVQYDTGSATLNYEAIPTARANRIFAAA